MQQRILIIGSDLGSCKKLKYALQDEKTGVYYALSVEDGMQHLIHYGYQIVILDISTPGIDVMHSLNLIQKARTVPMLVLSPIGNVDYIVRVLSVADDYLQKPYDIDICRAHIAALLRYFAYDNQQDAPGVLSKDGTLIIDTLCRKVYVLEIEVPLPRKQYDLLYLMASTEGRVFTHEQLYRNVWKEEYCGTPQHFVLPGA